MNEDNPAVEISHEEQLKRFLLHVSYSGMGVDDRLDGLLNALRTTLKKDRSMDEIKSAVDNITFYLRELEETSEKNENATEQQDPSKITLENIVSDLLSENINKDCQNHLNTLLKKSGKLSSDDFTHEFKNLLVKQFSQLKPKKNWLSFLNKDSTPDDNTVNLEQTDSEQLPTSLFNSLNRFIERMAVIDIYKETIEHLKKKVQQLESIDDLVPVIEDITSSLMEASSQEHAQFESFLKSLNKRLLHVASFLNHATTGHEALLKANNSLDVELTEHINTIKNDLETAEDFSDIKERFNKTFVHIFDSIKRFNETQNNRIAASMSELKIVTEQLQATEDEALRLKEDLAEQRYRAYTDPLTQMPNRYAYNERLSQEYSRWRRYRGQLSLVVGDIDYFKKINDTHGHDAGDIVLKQVSAIFMNTIRESDFVARFGGEEFVLLMPETGLIDATKAINKLRQTIGKEIINIDNATSIHVTISFGVAEFEGSDTAHKVFTRADKALLRAKEKGRNQVCCEKESS